MHDSRPCHELPRAALIERVARALREPELLADPRIQPGVCALCLSNLSRAYHVVDMRNGRVLAWDAAPGSPEALKAEGLRGADEVWVTSVKLCPCAEHGEIQHAAELANKERFKPKPAAAPRADEGFTGGARY